MRARLTGEWFDGRRWHPRDEAPPKKRQRETADAYAARVMEWVRRRAALMDKAYRRADGLIESTFAAMLGTGEPNSPERLQAAQRFERSAQADREERSASTTREAEAELIYQAARPFLHRKPLRNRVGFTNEDAPRTAWRALARHLSRTLDRPITPNRLRLICRRRP